MLRDTIALYTELSGNDGENTPIAIIGAYLDGYERGKADRPQGEWIVQRLQNGFDDVYCPFCKARPRRSDYGYYLKVNFCYKCGADLRVKKELEEVEND